MRNESTIEKSRSSYEKINYLLRPAKQVERKLIIEALHCLRRKFPIENYQYVGMGSLFYVDYYMFHKYLGIKDMISIEKDEEKIDRFKFNKPYSFIKLIPGVSTDVLPTLDWQKGMFIWLDYDDKMSMSIVDDIQIVCNYIKLGSLFIITVDAEPKRFGASDNDGFEGSPKQRLENFKKELHPYFPPELSPRDLSEKNFPRLLRRTIVNVIEERLRRRKLGYIQIFNVKYRDTSQMYTFGCVFENISGEIEDTGLFKLDFISKNNTLVEINLPIITPLEKIHFDKLIPGIAKKLKAFNIAEDKVNNYEKYYRYYPQYYESLL